MKKISISSFDNDVGFDEALELASAEAARIKCLDPGGVTVMAWYDRRSRRSKPEVGFTEGRVVNWAKSAASQGADVWVDLDEGAYIFLCGSSQNH